jgi:hypothetical protein
VQGTREAAACFLESGLVLRQPDPVGPVLVEVTQRLHEARDLRREPAQLLSQAEEGLELRAVPWHRKVAEVVSEGGVDPVAAVTNYEAAEVDFGLAELYFGGVDCNRVPIASLQDVGHHADVFLLGLGVDQDVFDDAADVGESVEGCGHALVQDVRSVRRGL